jgi:cellulose synthase/poly-beta-1,6-N-acetylglucosamine synthase-like glycosyltransferase
VTTDLLLRIALGLYLICSMLLHVYGINSYIMIGLYLRSRKARLREDRDLLASQTRALSDADLPVVTTQLPIYNEKLVLERLLKAVVAFDYPRDKHEIQLVDDSTDETQVLAARLAEEMRAAGHDVTHHHRPHREGYKAGALADAMKSARGDILAIFDADFVPPPDFLRKTVPYMLADDHCGFVQTRWGHRNRNFSMLTRLQSIGIDGHFGVEQPARCWSGLFFNFNGTAGIWRRQAIDEAGGWQPDTLTEDLDLSYRTLLAGWRARYLPEVVTPAEIPTDINALKSQQYRWAKGSIQGAVKLLPQVWRRRDLPLFKRIQATLHLTHYVIHPLILLITLLTVPLILLYNAEFVAVWIAPLLLLMFLALLGPITLYVFSQGVTKGSWRRTLLLLPVMMAFGIGLAVNNTRAVISGLSGRRSEFVRTPKLGDAAERKQSKGSLKSKMASAYQIPRSGTSMIEILLGVWAVIAIIANWHVTGFLAGPFLFIQAAGFAGVGLVSLAHGRTKV